MSNYTNEVGCRLIGRIRLNSRTRVCDPDYGKHSGDGQIISRILQTMPGAYDCFIRVEETCTGNRVGALAVINTSLCSYEEPCSTVFDNPMWKEEFPVQNHSGQMGIFSAAYFIRNAKCEHWYDGICRLTLAHEAGTINGKGVVSSTGCGNGCYSGSVIERNGSVVAIKIDFL